MRIDKITERPFLLFLPFLLFFIIWVIIYHSNGFNGDEPQYRLLAQNLLHGFYLVPAPQIIIPVGPGYPILLMPFIALGLPLICIALTNALFYYLSIVFLFKALRQIVSFTLSLGFSLFWALYYVSYQDLKAMIPEILTSFLISLLIYCLIKTYNQNDSDKLQKKYMYISGFVLGYLVLTKIVFGYVLIAMIIGLGLLWIVRRKNINYRKGLIVLLIAFGIQSPYLIYTHHKTGNLFYWGTTGGDNLYWMSNPNEGEYGDWWTLNPARNPLMKTNPAYYDSLKANHQKDSEELDKYTYYSLDQDRVSKKIAVENIKSHPVKFVQNILSNLGRMLFDYPYSYRLQSYKDLLRLPHSGVIVVFVLFCLFPTLMNWKKINFPIRFLLFIVLLYMGGSLLGSAEIRMFTKIVPVLLLWIAFILQNTLKIYWKFEKEEIENNKI